MVSFSSFTHHDPEYHVRPTVAIALAAAAAWSLPAALPGQGGQPRTNASQADDPIRALVSRLTLGQYKENVRGLTQFGDRRQGTDRNRAAIDWIEAQLKSYGCTNTERIKYQYTGRQIRPPDSTRTGRGGTPRAAGTPIPYEPGATDRAGDVLKGVRTATGVNMDPMRQPDTTLRRIDAQPDEPGEREEVYCTKVGTMHPDEMYIVGGHMDGHGFGAAANDDGSGSALVMQLARVFSSPDVHTDRSIRFILWNNEETGLNGSKAYVEQRQGLQGKEDPAGSGKYPEPRWLGMIQHDMMMFDHGMPRPDGTMNPEQRPEADVNIEFAGTSKMVDSSQKLAWFFRTSNEKYATTYPATVSDHMSNTDSDPFKDLTATLSLREDERLAQIGTGWDPQWHQPTDVFTTYSDKDFMLGLNAAQTTLSAVAQLVGATIK
jgi:hypothetical protein